MGDHAKRVTSVNIIEQYLSIHLFKGRPDFSVEPQSILNKRLDNVYIRPFSVFYTFLLPNVLLNSKYNKKNV